MDDSTVACDKLRGRYRQAHVKDILRPNRLHLRVKDASRSRIAEWRGMQQRVQVVEEARDEKHGPLSATEPRIRVSPARWKIPLNGRRGGLSLLGLNNGKVWEIAGPGWSVWWAASLASPFIPSLQWIPASESPSLHRPRLQTHPMWPRPDPSGKNNNGLSLPFRGAPHSSLHDRSCRSP